MLVGISRALVVGYVDFRCEMDGCDDECASAPEDSTNEQDHCL
jgi:hypothetical protein